jgi:hypothetical protein
MAMGESREITDKSIASDLLNAGYIEELKETKIKKIDERKETKTKKGGRKKSED